MSKVNIFNHMAANMMKSTIADKNRDGKISDKEAYVLEHSRDVQDMIDNMKNGNTSESIDAFQKITGELEQRREIADTMYELDANKDGVSVGELAQSSEYEDFANIFAGSTETFDIEDLMNYEKMLDVDGDSEVSNSERRKFGSLLLQGQSLDTSEQQDLMSMLQSAIKLGDFTEVQDGIRLLDSVSDIKEEDIFGPVIPNGILDPNEIRPEDVYVPYIVEPQPVVNPHITIEPSLEPLNLVPEMSIEDFYATLDTDNDGEIVAEDVINAYNTTDNEDLKAILSYFTDGENVKDAFKLACAGVSYDSYDSWNRGITYGTDDPDMIAQNGMITKDSLERLTQLSQNPSTEAVEAHLAENRNTDTVDPQIIVPVGPQPINPHITIDPSIEPLKLFPEMSIEDFYATLDTDNDGEIVAEDVINAYNTTDNEDLKAILSYFTDGENVKDAFKLACAGVSYDSYDSWNKGITYGTDDSDMIAQNGMITKDSLERLTQLAQNPSTEAVEAHLAENRNTESVAPSIWNLDDTISNEAPNPFQPRVEEIANEYNEKMSNRVLRFTYDYSGNELAYSDEILSYSALTSQNSHMIGEYRVTNADGKIIVPSENDIPEGANPNDYVVNSDVLDNSAFQNCLKYGTFNVQKYDETDGWQAFDLLNSQFVQDTLYTEDDAAAEAEYTSKMAQLDAEAKLYEMNQVLANVYKTSDFNNNADVTEAKNYIFSSKGYQIELPDGARYTSNADGTVSVTLSDGTVKKYNSYGEEITE